MLVLWLVLSGVYKPLIVWLGVGSSILAGYLVYRMDQASRSGRLDLLLRPLKTVGYLAWLLKEIGKSSIAVAKLILSPNLKMRRHFFTVPYSQKSELGETIFANSITLTPGTLTVETAHDFFWVHAVNYSGPEEMDALSDMDARVSATERS